MQRWERFMLAPGSFAQEIDFRAKKTPSIIQARFFFYRVSTEEQAASSYCFILSCGYSNSSSDSSNSSSDSFTSEKIFWHLFQRRCASIRPPSLNFYRSMWLIISRTCFASNSKWGGGTRCPGWWLNSIYAEGSMTFWFWAEAELGLNFCSPQYKKTDTQMSGTDWEV